MITIIMNEQREIQDRQEIIIKIILEIKTLKFYKQITIVKLPMLMMNTNKCKKTLLKIRKMEE